MISLTHLIGITISAIIILAVIGFTALLVVVAAVNLWNYLEKKGWIP